MESEWALQIPELVYDFQKLLVVRTSIRLFIFQAGNESSIEDITRQLIEQVAVFPDSQPGDRYLFAGYNRQLDRFHFRQFVY
jgi:hypothetical protein